MSFYSTSNAYKPHIRQEGFHLPSPAPSATTPPPAAPSPPSGSSFDTNNMFSMSPHNFLPDAFRRTGGSATTADLTASANGPGGHNGAAVDFSESDLANLMTAGSPPHHSQHAHERSTHSPSSAGGNYHEDHQHRPHNIFDISAPSSHHHQQQHQAHHFQPSSASSTTSSAFPAHFTGNPSSNPSASSHDFTSHFNSTLPALNSSMRYEPHPDPPPASFSSNQYRHTPSPTTSGHHNPQVAHRAQGPTASAASRSRSRSRPPSASNGPNSTIPNPLPIVSTNGGPARTTRSRRNGSISNTSPPPPTRPQAIVIPGAKPHVHGHMGIGGTPLSPLSMGAGTGANVNSASTNGAAWFAQSGEFSLPTPESLHSHSSPHLTHHHPSSQSNGAPSNGHGNGYSAFGISPPSGSASGPHTNGNGSNGDLMHLPPVSSLSNGHGHGMGGLPTPHSLNSMNGSIPGVGVGGGGMMHNHNHNHHSPVHPAHHPGSSSYGPPPPPPGMNGMGMVGVVGMGMMGTSSMGIPSSASSGGMTPTGVVGMNVVGSPIAPGSLGGGPPPSSSASSGGSHDKQALLAHEKRRRRRESHNAVERRRRDNINEKISELATLIPECLLDVNGVPSGTSVANGTGAALLSPTEDALLPSPLDAWPSKKSDDPNTNGGNASSPDAEGAVVKANKGMILRKSVEYIRYLQQLVTAQGARNRELEQELKAYRSGDVPPSASAASGGDGTPSSTTSTCVSDSNAMPQDDTSGGGSSGYTNVKPESGSPAVSSMMIKKAPSEIDADEEEGEMGLGMMLHEEVDFGGQQHQQQQQQSPLSSSSRGHGHKRGGSSYSGYGGMLPSMPEGEEDDDEGDLDDGEEDGSEKSHSLRTGRGSVVSKNGGFDDGLIVGMGIGVGIMGMDMGMDMGIGLGMDGMHNQHSQHHSHGHPHHGGHVQGLSGDDRMSVGMDPEDEQQHHLCGFAAEDGERGRSSRKPIPIPKISTGLGRLKQESGMEGEAMAMETS